MKKKRTGVVSNVSHYCSSCKNKIKAGEPHQFNAHANERFHLTCVEEKDDHSKATNFLTRADRQATARYAGGVR
jgi:hypothetical protein